MATKKITELQLISSITGSENLPADNGIQTYRCTIAQLKSFILSSGNIITDMIANLAVTTVKLADSAVTTVKLADSAVTLAKLSAEVSGAFVPVGMIAPYVGTSAPSGYLLCDGSEVSRTTYANLYALIGNTYGQGNNSTTFNVPDFRYVFLRGYGPDTTANGSGTVSSNNATFTSHGFTRTGLQVRLSSGTLSGLSTNTDYFVIVIDANTLAFATTRANALAGTKISISGTNSAVIVQNMDPGAGSRVALQTGGNTGANVGSYEDDALQGHKHRLNLVPSSLQAGGNGSMIAAGSTDLDIVTDGTNGTPRTDKETRPKNVSVNYIIKY